LRSSRNVGKLIIKRYYPKRSLNSINYLLKKGKVYLKILFVF